MTKHSPDGRNIQLTTRVSDAEFIKIQAEIRKLPNVTASEFLRRAVLSRDAVQTDQAAIIVGNFGYLANEVLARAVEQQLAMDLDQLRFELQNIHADLMRALRALRG